MKYFKQHFESGNYESTIYGKYKENDITPNGDVLCVVDDVDNDDDWEHIQHTIYQTYIEPDEVTIITEEEYQAVINKLREADGYYDKADEVLRTLL